MKKCIITIIFYCSMVLCLSAVASETQNPDGSPYDFNWKGSRDMSGAFFICAFTAYLAGDCPKVFIKCHTDPSLLSFTWRGVKMKCLNLFSFFQSREDANKAIQVADKETGVLEGTDQDDIVFEVPNPLIDSLEVTTSAQKSEYRKSVREDAFDVDKKAVDASERVFNADYSEFYYSGDGNGNGGWGHPKYLYDEYVKDLYTGEMPNDAYQRVWDDNYVRPNFLRYVSVHLPRSELIPYPDDATKAQKKVIDKKNTVLRNEYRVKKNKINNARRRHNNKLRNAEAARVDKIARRALIKAQKELDIAYSNWRSVQEWSTHGYKQDKFLSLYNENRVKIYFDAFVVAETSCIGCGYLAGEDSISELGFFNRSW